MCMYVHTSVGEVNGSPLQCSCLENPVDGGAWWAAVYGVTQSRTRLHRLSSSSIHLGHTHRVLQLPSRYKTCALMLCLHCHCRYHFNCLLTYDYDIHGTQI